MIFMKYIRFILFALLFATAIFPAVAQPTNPFMEMTGKEYGQYHEKLQTEYHRHYWPDTLGRSAQLELLKQAAEADGTAEWQLNCELFTSRAKLGLSRRGTRETLPGYTYEDFIAELLATAGKAEKKGVLHVQILSMFHIGEVCHIYLEDYERAFRYYLEAVKLMGNISSRDFPDKPHILSELAAFYYSFREYGEAAVYFQKIVDDPYIHENHLQSLWPAYNGLGLCYRYGFKDYEKSDEYFRAIFDGVSDEDRWVWEGIATCNIGYNRYLRGNYDGALELIEPGIASVTRSDDFPYAAGMSVTAAGIYLIKGNPASAKRYIDLANDYAARSNMQLKSSEYYSVLSRYYGSIGNRRNAAAFHDSTLVAKNRENDAFSGLVLRRVEQQLRAADRQIHQRQLDEEKIRSLFYRQTALIVSGGLVIILALLGLTLFLYRRNRAAYRELVRKSQRWAGIAVPDENGKNTETSRNGKQTAPDNTDASENHDRLIIADIEKAMYEKKLYKRSDLSLDILAEETGFNRYYLSAALNRSTGKNFNTYVNEYRVKEAIRILSDADGQQLTADAIAFESGFNDRISFYRVFKKLTGLSPTEFRKNINGG